MSERNERLHFRVSSEEAEVINRVVEIRGLKGKTDWLQSHIKADGLACGLLVLTEDEQLLMAAIDDRV